MFHNLQIAALIITLIFALIVSYSLRTGPARKKKEKQKFCEHDWQRGIMRAPEWGPTVNNPIAETNPDLFKANPVRFRPLVAIDWCHKCGALECHEGSDMTDGIGVKTPEEQMSGQMTLGERAKHA